MVRFLIILAMLIQPFVALGHAAHECGSGPGSGAMSCPIASTPKDSCCEGEGDEAQECCCCAPHATPASTAPQAKSDCGTCEAACQIACTPPSTPITNDSRRPVLTGPDEAVLSHGPIVGELSWPISLALTRREPRALSTASPGVHERLAILCVWTT